MLWPQLPSDDFLITLHVTITYRFLRRTSSAEEAYQNYRKTKFSMFFFHFLNILMANKCYKNRIADLLFKYSILVLVNIVFPV